MVQLQGASPFDIRDSEGTTPHPPPLSIENIEPNPNPLRDVITNGLGISLKEARYSLMAI